MASTFSQHYDKIKRLKDELNAAIDEASTAKLGPVVHVETLEHFSIQGGRCPVIVIKMAMEVVL